MTLKELLADRGLTYDAVALIARVDKATISRIANGKIRPRPETVVRLAKGLGISARRMDAICAASLEQATEADATVSVAS
jgi:transcriptional regulator with XRE-family HTH domain